MGYFYHVTVVQVSRIDASCTRMNLIDVIVSTYLESPARCLRQCYKRALYADNTPFLYYISALQPYGTLNRIASAHETALAVFISLATFTNFAAALG